MREVEVHLGETSMKCNTSRLGKSFKNQSKLVAQNREAGTLAETAAGL